MREFIVEADGGSRGNPGPAGYGAVVSDAATGETLRETAEYIGVATNNVAEYRGLLAGLLAARELDPAATVHVRMDSKLVIEQMSGRWKIKHPDMKPLATQAARVFPPGQVTYEWMPRAQNKHADRLANEAMDAGARGERWSESASTAELHAAPRAAATPEPPGDAAAGAARVRGALAAGRAAAVPAGQGPDAARAAQPDTRAATAGAEADVRAARAVGGAGVVRDDADARVARAGDDADARAVSAEAGVRTGGGGAVSGSAPGDADVRAAKAAGGAEAARAEAATRAATAEAGAGAPAAKAVASPGWAPADMGAPATFVLLRHGETPLTPQKRFSGSGGTDPSLSDTGREQAERAAAMLARRGTIQAVVSSPLARTRETAGIVAARLGLDVSIDDGLRETDFGAWEGLTFAEVRERHPDDLNAWLASPDAEPTGGGESFAATATRLAATRDKLVAAHAGRTVLLVTHVTPIKTLVRLALGAPPESLFRMELSAASLSVVAYYADGNASVRLLNDTSHLR
ncbi:bifunctional RNase H/acid phosphatase [Streptomyces paradoxus]|uniref:Putative phosphoglycerate mutase n=1 Tax=Streptomyces paradoxus TaxID=66375 RepID=A0A7W9T722_9ACTN|nr:bifunctional RNase H/acid phosphatase [Streptomyces paradoxus]MBB6075265.1 putative phosphoglycerate mutase [Streptomyces paradoxus]